MPDLRAEGAPVPRVLVVDDDDLIRRPLARFLRDAGLEPSTAIDGNEGLAKASAGRPDLIILDVRMPGRDGFGVCRELRRNPETAKVPVIFLTASDDEETRRTGLAVGASDFVTKPYSPAALMQRVRELLGHDRDHEGGKTWT